MMKTANGSYDYQYHRDEININSLLYRQLLSLDRTKKLTSNSAFATSLTVQVKSLCQDGQDLASAFLAGETLPLTLLLHHCGSETLK